MENQNFKIHRLNDGLIIQIDGMNFSPIDGLKYAKKTNNQSAIEKINQEINPKFRDLSKDNTMENMENFLSVGQIENLIDEKQTLSSLNRAIQILQNLDLSKIENPNSQKLVSEKLIVIGNWLKNQANKHYDKPIQSSLF